MGGWKMGRVRRHPSIVLHKIVMTSARHPVRKGSATKPQLGMAGFSTVVSATNMKDERIIVYVAGDQVVQTKQSRTMSADEVTIVVRPTNRQRPGWVGEAFLWPLWCCCL